MSLDGSCALAFCFSIFVPRLVSKFQAHCASPTPVADSNGPLLPYLAQQAIPEGGCVPHQIEFTYANTLTDTSSLARACAFTKLQNQRRSIRFYDPQPYPVELLMRCIETAGTAPSGAHQQPWHFSVVRCPAKKLAIRHAVEREEQQNYDRRMKQAWKDDLAPIFKNSTLHEQHTDKEGEAKTVIRKPYLTEAPFLVVVTEVTHGIHPDTGAFECGVGGGTATASELPLPPEFTSLPPAYTRPCRVLLLPRCDALFVCVFVCLCVCLFVCLSVCLSV